MIVGTIGLGAGLACVRESRAEPGEPVRTSPVTPAAIIPGSALGLEPVTSAPPKPTRKPGGWANVDPDDDEILGPPDLVGDCDAELQKAGVTFAKAALAVHEVKTKKSKITCGAHQVVSYLKGPGNIAWNAPPMVSCGMAAALATWEKIIQEEAKAIFKSPVARIDHIGTYNCREMVRYPGWVSEHAYANAIDIGSFTLKDGRTIQVERDFDMGDGTPKKTSALFLRKISNRAYDEDVFSHVLTPFWDALHKNHFHLDLARFRHDGSRPQ